ncbi:hypothetical protein BJ741DRAFT_669617 [Chytriomyces cf. hyalinus JEL632]|nr:hypothetical protein BJ741DRAFT_669617 [Chytriomyces cf. hyalinus JEL632]
MVVSAVVVVTASEAVAVALWIEFGAVAVAAAFDYLAQSSSAIIISDAENAFAVEARLLTHSQTMLAKMLVTRLSALSGSMDKQRGSKRMLSTVTTVGLEKKPGRPFNEESKIKMIKYMDLYSEYIDLGALDDYRNNLALYFPQYLKRFIQLSVELHWLPIFDQTTVAELTKEQQKVIKDDGSKIIQ